MGERVAGMHREQSVSAVLVRAAIGVVLIIICWSVSWLRFRPLSDYYFFPLWLGYILLVDALVIWRSGSSLIARSGWGVLWLFGLSVPLWWVFEAFNQLVHNWQYHLPRTYSTPVYAALCSLAFSTVMPAVLTTAELVGTFSMRPLRGLPRFRQTPRRLLALHITGWVMLVLTWLWPTWAFPLVWLSAIFLIDPLVTVLGGRSIGCHLAEGDWSLVSNLAVGTLICGFFWEFWNVNSLPKWTYSIPHVDWLHIFEMPVLGYGGYLPFGLEVYVAYALARYVLRARRMNVPDVRIADGGAIDRAFDAHL